MGDTPSAQARSPLTLGTAGHIDHGKTALIESLTGVNTDRLPEERSRGISIELGYARLELPSGRALSVVDVPGHERFVRTMVAGATGIDLFLMVVAADDGVMPQTREHAAVLAGLAIDDGVVAVTKSDVVDPAAAVTQVRELLPGREVVVTSARTGAGLDDLCAALDRASTRVPPREGSDPLMRMHLDRAFTIKGAGTVVTGTLWAGSIGKGDVVTILPQGVEARVRGVQVHDSPVGRAQAGQRVAVNLVGVEVREVSRGDVLVAAGSSLEPAYVLQAALELREPPDRRVQVHHGTRESPARLSERDGAHRLRLERPLMAVPGDRLIVRRIAPPDTIGGGTVLAQKQPSVRSARVPAGQTPTPAPLSPEALALEERLRAAGHEPPAEAELGEAAAELPALRAAGRAVRVGRALHYHPGALAEIRERVAAHCREHGSITIAQLRDDLGTSRKFAQALLEHFDATKLTRRRGDEHVLR